MQLILCHNAAQQAAESVVDLDVGLGHLLLEQSSNGLLWKFVPNPSFECGVLEALEGGVSPLMVLGEEVLAKKIGRTYTDLLDGRV